MTRRLAVETVACLAVAVVVWLTGWLLEEPEQWQPFEGRTSDQTGGDDT